MLIICNISFQYFLFNFFDRSPRPVIVEPMAVVDDNEGMSEINVNKRNPEYIKERQQGPRFAQPGSFEYE